MDLAQVLPQIKAHKRVSREAWNGSRALELDQNDQLRVYPYNDDGTYSYAMSQDDMFAEDWYVVGEDTPGVSQEREADTVAAEQQERIEGEDDGSSEGDANQKGEDGEVNGSDDGSEKVDVKVGK